MVLAAVVPRGRLGGGRRWREWQGRARALEISPTTATHPTGPLRGRMQEYVRSRLTQFLGLFSRRLLQLAPGTSPDAIERAAQESLAALPPPILAALPLEQKDLQLVFRHDCL